jgi:ABC-2 type transport system permease protein
MSRDVWGQTLFQERRGLLGWSVGVAGVAALYAGFYPAVSAPEFAQAYQSMPQGVLDAFGFQDLTSAEGYLGSTVFGLLGPVLVIVFSIAWGSRFVAGDEEGGGLDLLLAHPVSRPSVLLQRTLALAVGVLVLASVVWLLVALIAGPASIEVPLARLAAASLHLAVLGFTAGAVALAIGAMTGSKAAAMAGAGGFMVLSWMAEALAPQVEALRWLEDWSVWTYYDRARPLVDGVAPGDLAVLLGVAALALAAGLAVFRRRDLMV